MTLAYVVERYQYTNVFDSKRIFFRFTFTSSQLILLSFMNENATNAGYTCSHTIQSFSEWKKTADLETLFLLIHCAERSLFFLIYCLIFCKLFHSRIRRLLIIGGMDSHNRIKVLLKLIVTRPIARVDWQGGRTEPKTRWHWTFDLCPKKRTFFKNR